ncbi:hypothetical protein KKB41_04040 [Patescibacteria group bacterium]|nr:hypothetical protein [Patescibacteria group bacterium]
MTTKNLSKLFLKYRKSPQKQQAYLRAFEKKMLYRTTKTENPSTTKKMVAQILKKIETKHASQKKR